MGTHDDAVANSTDSELNDDALESATGGQQVFDPAYQGFAVDGESLTAETAANPTPHLSDGIRVDRLSSRSSHRTVSSPSGLDLPGAHHQRVR